MTDFPGPVHCPHDASLHAFEIDGKRYHLTPCRDPFERGRPHRITIHETDPLPGRARRRWEISQPLILGPRSKSSSLRYAFYIEFPEASTRAEAEQLVTVMFAQGVLKKMVPLKPHSSW